MVTPSSTAGPAATKPEVYGESGLGTLERTGVWLRTRKVRAQVRATRPRRILDIGCGHDAELLRTLLPSVEHATGIDLAVSESAKALPKTTFVEGWIGDESLGSLADESFDLVTMLSVLEHLEQPGAALAHCHRLVVPGGHLMVHVPTWTGKRVLEPIAFKLGKSTESIDDHKMYYSSRDLWPLLVRAGFRPRNVKLHYHTGGCALLAVAKREPC